MTSTPEEMEAIRARHDYVERGKYRHGDRVRYDAHNDRATLLPLAERCLKAEARVEELEALNRRHFRLLWLTLHDREEIISTAEMEALPGTIGIQIADEEDGYFVLSRRAAKTLKDT